MTIYRRKTAVVPVSEKLKYKMKASKEGMYVDDALIGVVLQVLGGYSIFLGTICNL